MALSAVLIERIWHLLTEAWQQELAMMFPLGRMEAPEVVALTTLFLASASSSWLAGITLGVARGQVML